MISVGGGRTKSDFEKLRQVKPSQIPVMAKKRLPKVFVSGDTLQVSDYSKLDWEWSMFDPEGKHKRHETVFPRECSKIFEMGKELVNG